MRRIKDETKIKQGRCKGEGLDYIPWIMANEHSSTGSSFIARNYKSGRDVHLLSNAEAKVYFLLLWEDSVLDIKEQYVLDLLETKLIAEDLGYRKPSFHMSTDFYLTVKDPIYNHVAISVKGNSSQAESKRTKEKLEIEKTYWEKRGVCYRLVFADVINPILVKNIRTVTKINKPEDIQDDVMALKYLLTMKEIETNMDEEIDYTTLLHENINKVDELYEELTNNQRRNWKNRGEIKYRNL